MAVTAMIMAMFVVVLCLFYSVYSSYDFVTAVFLWLGNRNYYGFVYSCATTVFTTATDLLQQCGCYGCVYSYVMAIFKISHNTAKTQL